MSIRGYDLLIGNISSLSKNKQKFSNTIEKFAIKYINHYRSVYIEVR